MTEKSLTTRLANLEAPEAAAARSRVMRTVSQRVQERRAASNGGHRAFPPRLAFALTLMLLAMVAASLFTAPGRAFTRWVGDRLGLGQPGGHPTLQHLRHFAIHGTSAQGQPAYVLLRGPAPGNRHYELVTFRMWKEPGKAFPVNGARCFEIDLSEARNLFSAGCGLPPVTDGLLVGGVGGNSAPGMSFRFVSGRTSADVAAVEVVSGGQSREVSLRPIPAELVERLHIRRPFKFFIAFLEGGETSLKVIARDETGKAVATRSVGGVDLQLP
jgi:hypothetical protein